MSLIYTILLDDYIDGDDLDRGPFTAGAVVIADNPTQAAELIATHMSDDAWKDGEVRQIGTANADERPIVVMVDLT
jgi:hypothetical protein